MSVKRPSAGCGSVLRDPREQVSLARLESRATAMWVAALIMGVLGLAGTCEAQSSLVSTPDGRRELISKAVDGERWAITRNPDGSVTGNVTLPGGDPAFLWCEERARTDADVEFGCWTAPGDPSEPCSVDRWSFLSEVRLPHSFFETSTMASTSAALARPPQPPAGAVDLPAGQQVTPDGLHVLINKTVGSERWAIIVNVTDQTVTGNVLTDDGIGFLWCARDQDDGQLDQDALQIQYSCWAAPECARGDCPPEPWSPAGTATVAGSFLGGSACRGPIRSSVDSAVEFLRQTMDRYHNRVIVYEDVSSAGNHFFALGKIPDQDAPVEIDGSWSENPHSGATAVRAEFVGPGFGGFYFMNGILPPGELAPSVNFGDISDAGYDLSGVTELTFWARGASGGELIDFFVGGVGRDSETGVPIKPFPGSTPRVPRRGPRVRLSTEWRQYRIDLSGADMSYVLGGFGWVASAEDNPDGAVFFLDDIAFSLSEDAQRQRLDEPRFLTSFITAPIQPDVFDDDESDDIDLVLRNLAFTYDNALVLLAFLAEGSSDSLRRARLIGDAFVYAAENDRFFDDGRVRTAYAAGDIRLPPGWMPNGRLGTVPVSGFFSENRQEFFEVEQEAVDVGNNSWTMIALLALFERTKDQRYLEAGRRVGEFIATFRNESGSFQGFFGRILDPESSELDRLDFASVEHNLDVAAAFRTMAALTSEEPWRSGSLHAAQFVEAMWEEERGCYLAGTANPELRNQEVGQLPLDVQPWAVLAIPSVRDTHPTVLECAERFHRTDHHGFSGYDFNDDRDGVWFEGTAHMATAYAFMGEFSRARELRAELRTAQATPPFGDRGGNSAACHDELSTGFGFTFFQRLHIAATAWHVFAQLGFDPYDQEWSAE